MMPFVSLLVGGLVSAFAPPSHRETSSTTFFVQIRGGIQTLAVGQTVPATNWTKTSGPCTTCTGPLHTCYVITSTDNPQGTNQVVERYPGTCI